MLTVISAKTPGLWKRRIVRCRAATFPWLLQSTRLLASRSSCIVTMYVRNASLKNRNRPRKGRMLPTPIYSTTGNRAYISLWSATNRRSRSVVFTWQTRRVWCVSLFIPCRRYSLFLRPDTLVPSVHSFLFVRMRVPADVLLRDERERSVPFLPAGCGRAHPRSR